ncbi:MAG: class I SAM-dependent methyltransferase [Thermoanaerobaculia bacterium]
MSAGRPPSPPFVDITALYPDGYFASHPLFGGEALATVATSPVAMTPAERLLLWSLAYALRPAAYVEIGTREGGSALLVASALATAGAPGRIVCVDPEPRIAPATWARLAPRATLLAERSPAALLAARAAAGTDFDLALVDGDHAEDAVLADAEGLVPHLAERAWLLFHDAHFPEVAHAVDRFLAADAPRRTDLGWLTREFTVESHPAGGERAWGGLRGVLVRR